MAWLWARLTLQADWLEPISEQFTKAWLMFATEGVTGVTEHPPEDALLRLDVGRLKLSGPRGALHKFHFEPSLCGLFIRSPRRRGAPAIRRTVVLEWSRLVIRAGCPPHG
jgi:hypothetical protein